MAIETTRVIPALMRPLSFCSFSSLWGDKEQKAGRGGLVPGSGRSPWVLEARFEDAGSTTASDFDPTPLWSKSDARTGALALRAPGAAEVDQP